jgi:hypothetical protein
MTTRSFTSSSASADRRASIIAEVRELADALRARPPGSPRPFILFPARSGQAIRHVEELRRFLEALELDDVLEDLGADWTLHDVPGSDEPLFLPRPPSWPWDEVVDTIVASGAASETSGPWISERREELCRSGDVYFVHLDRDGDHRVAVVGRFDDEHAGLAAVVAASESFVLTDAGVPVSLWFDEEATAWELDDITDDEADEADEDDDGTIASDAVADAWERLRDTVVADSPGVVLAGPDATAQLPSPTTWYAVTTSDALHAGLVRVRPTARRGSVTIDGTSSPVTLIDDVPHEVVGRLAEACGLDEVHVLEGDELRLIDVHRRAVVARVLRDHL